MPLIPDLPWNVGLPNESPFILPFKIRASTNFQESFSMIIQIIMKTFSLGGA